MQAVLDAWRGLGVRPTETLSPAQARRQPSLAAAIAATLKAQGRPADSGPALTTRDLPYASDPAQTLRLYTPEAALQGPRAPVIVYFHGGGWVTGDLDAYDATARALARQSNAIVVSVDSRRAPENRFPSQQADAHYAYDWIVKRIPEWRGDRGMIAVAGEGAGAALALSVAIRAKDLGKAKPKAVLALYPWVSGDTATASKTAFANAQPLDAATVQWWTYYAAQTPGAVDDPRFQLIKADLRGLAPVTIINAEIDPLLDDGALLEQALKAADVRVERRVFPGVTHDFFGMGLVVRGPITPRSTRRRGSRPPSTSSTPGSRAAS